MVKAVSQDKVNRIMQMRKEGFHLKIIAYEVGASTPTVGKYLRQAGLTVERRRGRRTHKERQCLNCKAVQTISAGNKSKVCRPCEDNRKRGLWSGENLRQEVLYASR